MDLEYPAKSLERLYFEEFKGNNYWKIQCYTIVPNQNELKTTSSEFQFDIASGIAKGTSFSGQTKQFYFDQIFYRNSFPNEMGQKIINPMVLDVATGYNSCLFCFGSKDAAISDTLFGDGQKQTGNHLILQKESLGHFGKRLFRVEIHFLISMFLQLNYTRKRFGICYLLKIRFH
jgi:hypothetical protein